MTYNIHNNPSSQHIETEADSEKAFIEYRMKDDAIALMHTFVPPALEGRGIAAALTNWALEYVKHEASPLIVYCPYIAAYMKKHPEYDTLLQNPAP